MEKLFRGKNKKNGEWMFGYLGECKTKILNTLYIEKVIFNNLISFATDNFSYVVDDLSVDENTIGRNMFLKDKNQKEIYDGDIVKVPAIDPIFCDMIKDLFVNALVTYNNGIPVIKYYSTDKCIYIDQLLDKIEIVGNIHDNPELLETKNLYY